MEATSPELAKETFSSSSFMSLLGEIVHHPVSELRINTSERQVKDDQTRSKYDMGNVQHLDVGKQNFGGMGTNKRQKSNMRNNLADDLRNNMIRPHIVEKERRESGMRNDIDNMRKYTVRNTDKDMDYDNERNETTWEKSNQEHTDLDAKEFQAERDYKMAAPCRSDPRHSNMTKSLFYCGIAKVASTFTGQLMGKIPYCNESKMCHLRTDPDVEEFAFMWAREPYGRLFAAYENKLFSPNNFWKKLGVPIIKALRQNATEKSLKYGHDVTFAELVKYVINVTADGKLNVHFQPMYKSCNPCEDHFDFVGKMETFTEDVDYVCRQFIEKGFLKDTSQCNDVPSKKRLLGRVHKLYETLSYYGKTTTSKDRFKLMLRLWKSYQIRGLLSKRVKMPYTVDNVGRIKLNQFSYTLYESIQAFTNKSQLKAQRQEALVQAYMTVPLDDMEKLKDFVEKDCLIFGYDLRPASLFRPRTGYIPEYDYFDGLN